MHHTLLMALLAAATTGATSAQVAGPFATDRSAFWPDPAVTHVAISSGSLTNSILTDPGIHGHGTLDLVVPSLGESLVPNKDLMAVDGRAGGSFVDPDAIQAQRQVLFHKLDLLLRAYTPSSPVYFGVDHEVKFVEQHDYQPGIPVPVGMSYSMPQKRWTFFTEFAPILDPGSVTSMGWGGGIGIRFYFGR
jgi:hypothetical protein